MSEKLVRVGIGVFVFKGGKFLLQQRQGSHGAGSWAPPGGHLEFGESFEDTARREVLEETGIKVTNLKFGAGTNDNFASEGKHYVTIWMLSDWQSGEPQITEPNKCREQRWCGFDDLPSPMFLPWQNLAQSEFYEKIQQQSKSGMI
jgi:8-oxo-dGTP diphosphatase